MSGWLVDLLILLGILAIVVIAGWFVLQQMTLPEPIQRILIIVLVILAAIIGVAILLSMRGGVKITNAPFPLIAAASEHPGGPAGRRHHARGALIA